MRSVCINGQWTLSLPADRVKTDHSERQIERLTSMHRNIGPGDVVFDIGAGDGAISALIQSWIGHSDGGMVLWEPDARIWANIFTTWKANNLKSPLGYVNAFAADMDRLVQLISIDDWPDESYGPVVGDHGFRALWDEPDIPSIRVDDYIEMTGQYPSILVIDVEGAEMNVLDGAMDVLSETKPLTYVSIYPQSMRDNFDRAAHHLHVQMSFLGYREKHLATDDAIQYVFWHPEGRELRF